MSRPPPTPTPYACRPRSCWPRPAVGAEEHLAAAEAEAQRQLAAAAEQTSWTQQTVQSLLATADLEADRIRQVGHRDAVDVVRRARQGIVGVAARMRDKLDIETETSRHGGRQQRRRSAEDALASAAQEAQQTRADGEREAARIREDAEATAAHTAERAQHRLDEAEQGARALREQVAEEVLRLQRTGDEELRQARTESAAIVAQARHEADELRAQARRIVEEARAEVALLARQRDGITEELGQLSASSRL